MDRNGGDAQMKEGASFFTIAIAVLALCFGYIYSQGGSPFALAGDVKSISQPASSCGQDYRCMARQDAVDAGIDPILFERQINEESGFNPSIVSGEGAVGIAQFLPSTAQGLGIDPWNAEQSLRGAAQLMSRYQAKYGSYQHGLAAYNCGSGCLESAMARCGLSWKVCVPVETQTYIAVIEG